MRFRREALAATVLRHPNIVACLEAGTDDGQPYLVMELIEGEDLAARLSRGGRLAPSEVARIGLDVARALGVAHIRGIVHRDIKPGNILLARDGRALVTDFGIARLAADAEGAVPGTTLGSVHYFSPEQATGQTTSPASDVYGLGLVLYEALVGKRAWAGQTTAEIASARVGHAAPSPRVARPEVPPVLDEIVVRALDPDPLARYPNGNAMSNALEPVVAAPALSSPTTVVETVPAIETVATGALAPPLRPSMLPIAGRQAEVAANRRGSPVITGPLMVLLLVAAVVAGALLIAALPGPGDPTGLALASARPTPTRTAKASPTGTPKPSAPRTAAPTQAPTQAPTPAPTPTPKPPGPGVSDVCEPFFGFACGLGAGKYQPSVFKPAIRFALEDGWSVATLTRNLLALGRDDGVVTFASSIDRVYPTGSASSAPTTAQGLVEAFIGTDGVAADLPFTRRAGKRPAVVVDLAPDRLERIALFSTAGETFYLEPFGTTRIIAIDGKDGLFAVAIEPGADSTFESIRRAGQAVVKTLRFR